MKRTIHIILCICCLSLCGCQMREKQVKKTAPIPVEVVTIASDITVPQHTYVGEIEEKSSVVLSCSAAGRVLEVHATRGARVQAGQVLVRLDSTQAVNARLSAAATLRQAEDGYARAMQMHKEGGLTEQKRIELESKLEQARSMYASTARMVEDCELRAPVSGTISECNAKTGETVAPGLPLIRIINMDGFRVRFAVPESEVASIKTGERALLQVPASELELQATVTEKSLVPNKLAHTYEVVADIEGKPELLPGMMAKVQLKSDVISGVVLPQECVQMLPDGAKVWVAEDGKAVRKQVVVGQHVHNGVLITEGISEGNQVIIKGYQKLWQGAEITY